MSQINSIQRPDVESVLAQMRALRQAASGEALRAMREPDAAAAATSIGGLQPGVAPPNRAAPFGQALASALERVNTLQLDASAQREAFVRGETQDLVKVMIASQKSDVAFQAATQVRNRLVSAYQDIMNMPI